MNYDIVHIPADELSFDYRNPRIAEFNYNENTPEKEIIRTLWNVMGVEEIVLSIKASGFFQHEPLIALEEGGKKVIIEGNRRLAAVKCILHPEIADFVPINRNSLLVDKAISETLSVLPIIIVKNRKAAWKFIGFKHINGPAKWGSYAKAQYISEIKNEYEVPLEDIASQIGDTHRTVQKLYQGLQIIEQAERRGKFDRNDITANRLYFSHLYTGLTYEGFKDYLGLKDISEELKDPVPEGKLDHLEELLTWIFGSKKKEIEPVIQSQNPDLRYLEGVLRSQEALYALRDRVPLQQAYELSQPKSETFEQSLLEAKRSLQKAQSYLTEGFDGKNESLLRQAGTVADIADELYQSMETKWKSLHGEADKPKRLFTEE